MKKFTEKQIQAMKKMRELWKLRDLSLVEQAKQKEGNN